MSQGAFCRALAIARAVHVAKERKKSHVQGGGWMAYWFQTPHNSLKHGLWTGYCVLPPIKSCQGEMAKRILKLTKWLWNTAAKIHLPFDGIHHQEAKVPLYDHSKGGWSLLLCFLLPMLLCLVRDCWKLEERYRVDYTSTILAAESEDSHSVVKEMVEVI